MSELPVELQRVLEGVRRRWRICSLLHQWTLGAAAAATVLAAGLGAVLLIARDGAPLAFVGISIAVLALAACALALWPLRHTPDDRRIARLIEERAGGLDDTVVTAVDYAARADASPRMRVMLARDAATTLSSFDAASVIPSAAMRRAAWRSAAATAALVLAAVSFAPHLSRATNVAFAYLFPAQLHVEVSPGTTKVRAGEPLTITARVPGLGGDLVPVLTISIGAESRELRMLPAEEAGTFALNIENVAASFSYHVRAASTKSEDYSVTAIHPPRVERIDLYYEFPAGLGLSPRTDEDSGDIYGPVGTSVRLTVVADKPIASASLVMDDGTKVPLDPQSRALGGKLTIEGDGSYRVALTDNDGLESAGDTEYFIRTLDDRPPDVRILRPATDKQVTPLEEVLIEARADDDYGIASFDLVFQAANGKERVVPLRAAKRGVSAEAMHTLFMEELGVLPGDFVTYYARARDVNRGRRSVEARSDIFFLEVKPFEEEFVAAQSQAMGQGAGMQSGGLQGLAEAQKEIIVATWKLDARARRARDARSQEDIKAIGRAQSDLRTRVEKESGQSARVTGDPRRRRAGGMTPPGEDPLGRAAEAMGRAVNALDRISTSEALPHEMEALNQLLKADAEIRRRQVTRQQQAGGGGMNRPEADLSSLFDQELRRRQETNYETPNSTEQREDEPEQDPLERIRELARRQNALNRQQQDLMRQRQQMAEEELQRQLERLTREQNELRQQAEQLAQQMQQSGNRQQSQNGQSGSQTNSGGSGSQDSRRLREISEDMRDAATGMRRQDPTQAANGGSRAADRLRDLERRMQGSRPDDRRRAIGDLQLETRQLADAQRRLANEAGRAQPGQSGDDTRRRLAGDQDRLADRAQRLQDQVRNLSRAGEGADRTATGDAARELERSKVAERMRQSAESLRKPGTDDDDGAAPAGTPDGAQQASREAARQGEDLARTLDRIADRLGAAAGTQDADSQRLSDSLARTQELRDRVAALERSLEEMRRESQQQQADGQAPADQRPGGEQQRAAAQSPQQAQGSQQGTQQGQAGQQSADGRQGSSGQQGSSAGGNGGRMQQLQRDVNERARELERLTQAVRRENPGMQGPNPDEGWWRSVSAPGTEAFKQDFAKWESLKNNLLVALEDVESKLSGALRARENQQRFNVGGHQAVTPAYRELVDKYYRSLAAPRKPPQ